MLTQAGLLAAYAIAHASVTLSASAQQRDIAARTWLWGSVYK